MTMPAPSFGDAPAIEALLADELAVADLAQANVWPIMRHLLGSPDDSLFSDRVVAQVRAQLESLAAQLLAQFEHVAGTTDAVDRATEVAGDLATMLADDPLLLAHVHGLAIEYQLGEQLAGRLALDTVLPPFIQAMIASPDPDRASNAMAFLAAQARFVQTQKRGELPLAELPADVLHAVLGRLGEFLGDRQDDRGEVFAALEQLLRGEHDEAHGRLGLLQRLVCTLGGDALSALDVLHAGVPAFLTTLAQGSGLSRECVVLATSEVQAPRLALALLASGLRADRVEAQFLAIHPQISLPDGLERLRADRAAGLLAASFAD